MCKRLLRLRAHINLIFIFQMSFQIFKSTHVRAEDQTKETPEGVMRMYNKVLCTTFNKGCKFNLFCLCMELDHVDCR